VYYPLSPNEAWIAIRRNRIALGLSSFDKRIERICNLKVLWISTFGPHYRGGQHCRRIQLVDP